MLEYDVTDKEDKIRITRFVKVIIETFHSQAAGGGLLHFGVEAAKGKTFFFILHSYILFLCPAPICDIPLDVPENSSPASKMQGDYIGQEITIECWEGFEFTDTPAAFIATVDNTQSLGVTVVQLNLLNLHP